MQGTSWERWIAYHARPCMGCGVETTADQVWYRRCRFGRNTTGWYCSGFCFDRDAFGRGEWPGHAKPCWVCGKEAWDTTYLHGHGTGVHEHQLCYQKLRGDKKP